MAKLIDHATYKAAALRADAEMKKRNGHTFETILKTRCIHCGKSPKVKTRCGGWFQTFLSCLAYELTDVYGI